MSRTEEIPTSRSRPSGSRRTEAEWTSLVPPRWYARHGHRWLDRVLLSLLLLPALPLMALIAVVNTFVFRSIAQVFYLQPRIGYCGRPFQIYKFRTMKEDRGSAMGSWSDGRDHMRVTRFGRWLRNTHLDELPQLFNILRGEMSFIGPRPEMVEVEIWASEHVPAFSERLAIRPGVAGLAQITQGYTGRCTDAYAEKLEINRNYLQRMSFGLDLQIVLRTMVWMVRGKGWSWNHSASSTSSKLVNGEVQPAANSQVKSLGESDAVRERVRTGS